MAMFPGDTNQQHMTYTGSSNH